MKRTVYYPEIFAMVGEVDTKEEKIAVLHKFKNEKGFYDILRMCYDPLIKWVVTREEIENLVYDHMDIADFDMAPTTLFLEARRRLYNFTNVRTPPLKHYKVIQLITGMFSVLHHEEVELFKQMVSGNIEDTGITEDLVREAFPNLLSVTKEEYVQDVKEKVAEITGEDIPTPAPTPPPEKKEKKKEKKKSPPGKKSKLDSHKKDILKMIDGGKTRKEIAEKYKTSTGNLYNWLKKNTEKK